MLLYPPEVQPPKRQYISCPIACMSIEKLIYRWLFRKPLNRLKGWAGEQKTKFNIWLNLDPNTYRRFSDIILPGSDGTAQIDHLLVSPYGLFIIETKNKKGWIFGSENQQNWTQVLYSEKYSFQNPLRQTYRQKRVLAEFLNLRESAIHTVVHFVGDCTIKTKMPPNVGKTGLGKYIKSFKHPVFSDDELDGIRQTISHHVKTNQLSTKDHIQSVRARIHSSEYCRECGSELRLKTARSGSRFPGCSHYPSCRFTGST